MNTIKTFIPSELVDAFKKFAEKTKRNVEGFDYSISNPRKKLFRHAEVEDYQTIIGKYWHDICDLTINMPDESNWRLMATYKNGAFTPADTTKELVFKIKEHGANYGKCDLCGHWCNNAYVIENTQTGDELQVGCECIKKFGLKYIYFLVIPLKESRFALRFHLMGIKLLQAITKHTDEVKYGKRMY